MKLERNLERCLAAAALAILLAVPSGALPTYALTAKTTSANTAAKSAKLIDVNHATLAELATLPGIQDAYAAKIVKHRPYANKTQLSSEGVIPAATYRKIRALIIAKQ